MVERIAAGAVAALTLSARARLDLLPGGPLTVGGDLELASGTALSLPLVASAPLAVDGDVTLAGTLRLTLPAGGVHAGGRYPLLTAAALHGGFDQVVPPPGLTVTLEQGATGIEAVVGP